MCNDIVAENDIIYLFFLTVQFSQPEKEHIENRSKIKVYSYRSTLVALRERASPSFDSRDRLVVRTLRCGRSNPGSNPGHGNASKHCHGEGLFYFFF